MTNRFLIALLSCSLLVPFDAQALEQASGAGCEVDRARVLALDEQQFDQDMAGGWRAIADKPGCSQAAADLIRDWRQKHGVSPGLLVWHEAQLRASAGQTPEAIALMTQARRGPGVPDKSGWNIYVDASVAFLRKDMAALQQQRAKLAAVAPPSGPNAPVTVVDGYFDIDMGNGETMKMRWPPNIDVVDGLIACFDKPYAEAYRSECQPRRQ
jgi:hypothetical protein